MTPERQRARLLHMRLIATLLLIAMTLIFILTKIMKWDQPWIPYLRAFAEAGMVGACADWFAVVALFRHPLGLPIPHTGIVPANKGRIADALGRFISHNFLARRTVHQKLSRIDIAGALAKWLADPENAAKIAVFCSRALPDLVKILPENRIRAAVDGIARRGAQSVPAAPLSAHILEALWADGEAQALLDRAIVYTGDVLFHNKEQIHKTVSQKSPVWMPKWIDAMLADRVVDGLIVTLAKMRDPNHPWRRELQKSVQKLIRSLAEDPKLIARAEEVKARVLADPVLLRQAETLWSKMEAGLFSDLTTRGDDIAKAVTAALSGLGEWLSSDPAVTARLNRRIRLMALQALPPRRREIGAYIAEVVRNWDTTTLVEKLELSVGRDLQYIRINGTLVGGAVGLAIYALGQWLDGGAF
jgi:uncharacterized membrane-anchored protein YjiN (DUF445 family)